MKRFSLSVGLLILVAHLLTPVRGVALPYSPCGCSVNAPVRSGSFSISSPSFSCPELLGMAEVTAGDEANRVCNSEDLTLCSITYGDGGTCGGSGHEVCEQYTFQCSVCDEGGEPNY
ncbi:MAG TPA: hypothetical protein VLV54_16545 [Thermoanaerobaculia bacterium]|nr:hypothetical protein [Thermoanaerobaculia bacterium]